MLATNAGYCFVKSRGDDDARGEGVTAVKGRESVRRREEREEHGALYKSYSPVIQLYYFHYTKKKKKLPNP